MVMPVNKNIRLNLGCASRPLSGYVNVDMDTLEQIQNRYPGIEIPKDIEIFQYDIFNLPFSDGSVEEIRADAFLEHLSFSEEKKFFIEVKRVLKKEGLFQFSVPDFEEPVRLFLAAKDEWKDFYRDDEEAIQTQHWFGNYSYSTENRWGYLMAMIFGPQNSPGQFHKNAYTEGKIRGILDYLEFDILEIEKFRWKQDRDLMIQVKAQKR